MTPPTDLLSPAALDLIDQQAAITLETAVAPGLALALIDTDGRLVIRNHGFANRPGSRAVDSATTFEIGSIGKSFTAIVFTQLEREGVIDLRARVTNYLPWFEIPSDHRAITIHDLLTHTSGLPGGHDQVPDARYEVWSLRRSRTFAAPNEHFLYSNVGYKTLGLVLERVLDKPYAEIVKERILRPLGMANSYGAITAAMRPTLAQGYAPRYDDRPWLQTYGVVPATWLETNTGDGCLAMNAGDLAIYACMLLRAATGRSTPVLSPADLQRMRSPHQDDTPEPAYGYALETYTSGENGERFGHSGGMVGYVTQMTIDVTQGIAAVVLANGGADTTGLASFILDTCMAERTGTELPAIQPAEEGVSPDVASDYIDRWQSDGKCIDIISDDLGSLQLVDGDDRILLQAPTGRRRGEVLVADHPRWLPFPLEFERAPKHAGADESEAQPPVVKMHHGGTTWYRAGTTPDPVPDHPVAWEVFAGHYRSFNPWQSNFRIVIRGGKLVMLSPFGGAVELVPDGTGFRYGYRDTPSTEWITFDAIVDGQALVARSDVGEEFARFFTP